MDLKIIAVFVAVALATGAIYAVDKLSAPQIRTADEFGFGERNGTAKHMGMGRFNDTTEHSDFLKAVENGDYSEAKKLHDEYGFGGPIFDKLNETTFAKFAQIQKLQKELATELGFGGNGQMPPIMGFGMREGPGMMHGKGMGRHGGFARHGINQTAVENQPPQ